MAAPGEPSASLGGHNVGSCQDRQRSSERQETVWGFIDCRLKREEFAMSEGVAVVDLAVAIAQVLLAGL